MTFTCLIFLSLLNFLPCCLYNEFIYFRTLKCIRISPASLRLKWCMITFFQFDIIGLQSKLDKAVGHCCIHPSFSFLFFEGKITIVYLNKLDKPERMNASHAIL